jgi:HEAT repeat protein
LIRQLESELEKARSAQRAELTPEEKKSTALEIYNLYLDVENSKSVASDKMLKLLGQLPDLGTDGASVFLRLYKENQGKEDKSQERLNALSLALTIGGPDVATFVNELLNQPDLPELDRENLLSTLGGLDGSFFNMARLPVRDAELGQTGFKLIQSKDPSERLGGVGLLGGLRTPQAVMGLQQTLETDSDLHVRVAAVRALGASGGRDTFVYLQAYYERNLPVLIQNRQTSLLDALSTVITELAEK